MSKTLSLPHILVAATPIGNLEDITLRVLRALKEADIIACEDTRNTRHLLSHFAISGKELLSYHDFNEKECAQKILQRLKAENLSLVLVSDAGTPAIADPGHHLLALAHEHHVPVHPLPGPSALASIISVSGIASTPVHFFGFLPKKDAELKKTLLSWRKLGGSVVFYESPHRLLATLDMLAHYFPEAKLCVGKELTKLFEEVLTDSVGNILRWAKEKSSIKGEYALMLDLPQVEEALGEEEVVKELQFLLAEGISARDAIRMVHGVHGISKKKLYQLALEEA